MRISDWSSDVCSSDLLREAVRHGQLLVGHSGLEGTHRPAPQGGGEFLGGGLHVDGARGLRHLLEVARVEGVQVDDGLESSEGRRGGKVCVSPCRSRWSPSPSKKKKNMIKI